PPGPMRMTCPPRARTLSTWSGLRSPSTIGTYPKASAIITIRRATVDFPRPGLDRKNAEGLDTMPARNQLIGSQHTDPPIDPLRSSWRPNGAPIAGAELPELAGYRPHTWRVVPRHSIGTGVRLSVPRPRPRQPIGPGRSTRGLAAFAFALVRLTTGPRTSASAPPAAGSAAAPAAAPLRTPPPARHRPAAAAT